MDKAIIFCVFDFVGFHICKSLLDKGIEVKGVSVKENEGFLDEKRLEIGRNANFMELPFTDWVQHFGTDDTVILSLYDLYMVNKIDLLANESFIDQILQNITKISSNLILVAPSQLLTSDKEQVPFNEIDNFITKCKDATDRIQIIYLPTMYGPWQPETFIFQHTILSNFNRSQPFTDIREDTRDALYINDTVKSMIDLFESGKKGSYLFEGSIKNLWRQCAAYLQINNQLIEKQMIKEVKEPVNKITVETNTDIAEGLTKQIELSKRLYRS